MLVSIWQIDFIAESGVTTRLLSAGDLMADVLQIPATIQSQEDHYLGADWAGAVPLGNARRSLSWVCVREHASHADAASFVIRHPAAMPLRTPGKIRISITGGEVWDFLDAVITSATPNQYKDGDFATYTAYQASAGKCLPVSGLAIYTGIPIEWILSTHAALATNHSALT